MPRRRRKQDADLIFDIVAAARAAQRFVEGTDREAFMRSEKDQYAVTRAIEIIGEAATKLSPAFLASHSQVPWRSIIGMRHRIVHHYDAVDLDVVWQVVAEELPQLLSRLAPEVDDA
jgi:uncharacterized protein with HEPN domain